MVLVWLIDALNREILPRRAFVRCWICGYGTQLGCRLAGRLVGLVEWWMSTNGGWGL